MGESMKKFLKSLVLIFIILPATFFLTACGTPTVVNIEKTNTTDNTEKGIEATSSVASDIKEDKITQTETTESSSERQSITEIVCFFIISFLSKKS